MPTVPQTPPLAGMLPGENDPPAQAPNRELNDSDSALDVAPSSLCTSVATVTATPPVSWILACVNQPCGVEKLQPVVLNAAGLASKVIVNAAVGTVGAEGVPVTGVVDPLLHAHVISAIATALAGPLMENAA